MKSKLLVAALCVGMASTVMADDKLFYHIGSHHTGDVPYNGATIGLGFNTGNQEFGIYRHSYSTWVDNGPMDGAAVYYGRKLVSTNTAIGEVALNANVAFGYPGHAQNLQDLDLTVIPIVTLEKGKWRLGVIPGQLVGNDSVYTLSYNLIK